MRKFDPSEYSFVSPRPTVEVHLPDGRVIAGPRQAPVGVFLKLLDDSKTPIVGAVVNHELRELTYPIELDARVRPARQPGRFRQ